METKSFQLTRLILISFTLIALSVMGTAAAIPGPQRALAPTLFGLKQIEPSVFIDTASKSDEAKAMLEEARSTLKLFFGDLQSNPKIVICTEVECHRRLGGGPRGIAYGYDLIKIGPKGFTDMIITHEMFHTELHKRMGRLGMIEPKFPIWFNEGLATLISNDNRYRTKFTPDELVWIKTAISYWGDWGDKIAERGWRVTYGAAKTAVIILQNEIGQRGILDVIDLVSDNTMNFEDAVSFVRRSTL